MQNREIQLVFTILILVIAMFPPFATAAAWNPEDVLRTHLKENYPWSDVRISDLVVDGDLPVRKPVKIMVEKGLPGRTVFSLEFEDNKRLIATANIKIFDGVVVSRRAFKKGYILQKDDVYTMLMEVQRIPANAVNSIEQAVGKPLTRAILANMPVNSGMLSEGVTVKRGRKVTLVFEADGFRISTTGEIRENGSIGSMVKAVNTASKKMLAGILVDENTVKVEL
jgi:flagella basal body P-ring formation protein FlgA